jgi:hypothetical protein
VGLGDFFIRYALTPRIVDREPGRLRVAIPILSQVTPQWKPLADQVVRLLRLPNGVHSVEGEDRSGILTFNYDTQVIPETEVIIYLRGLLALVIRYVDRFAKLTPERVPAVIDRIEGILTDALARGDDIGRQVRIPDDVWA